MLKTTLLGAALCCIVSSSVHAQQADLRLTMLVTPPNPTVRQPMRVTMIVDNLGPNQSVLPRVVLEAVTEPQQFVEANGCSLSVRTTGGLAQKFDCNFFPSTGIFQLAEFQANWLNPQSGSDDGRMVGTIDLEAYDPGELVFRAWVASDTLDPNTDNNVAVTKVNILPASADLSIDLSSVVTPNAEGVAISYEAVVTNNGPSNVNDATVVFQLPGTGKNASKKFTILVMSPFCVYDPDANTITCEVQPRLPLNPERIVAFSIQWTGSGANVATTATVSDAVVPDPNPDNNTDTEVVDGRKNK